MSSDDLTEIAEACGSTVAEATIVGSGQASSGGAYREEAASCADAYVVDINNYSPRTLTFVNYNPQILASMTEAGKRVTTCSGEALHVAVWEKITGGGSRLLGKIDAPFTLSQDLSGQNVCVPPSAVELENWVPGFGVPGKSYRLGVRGGVVRSPSPLSARNLAVTVRAVKAPPPKSRKAQLQEMIGSLRSLYRFPNQLEGFEQRPDGLDSAMDAISILNRGSSSSTGKLRARARALETEVLSLARSNVLALGVTPRVYDIVRSAAVSVGVTERLPPGDSTRESYVKQLITYYEAQIALLDNLASVLPYANAADPGARDMHAGRVLEETIAYAVSAMFSQCRVPTLSYYQYVFEGVGTPEQALLGSCNVAGKRVEEIAGGLNLGRAGQSGQAPADIYRACVARREARDEAKCKTDPKAEEKVADETPEETNKCATQGSQPGSPDCQEKVEKETGNKVQISEQHTTIVLPDGSTGVNSAFSCSADEATCLAAQNAFQAQRNKETDPIKQQINAAEAVANARRHQDDASALPGVDQAALDEATGKLIAFTSGVGTGALAVAGGFLGVAAADAAAALGVLAFPGVVVAAYCGSYNTECGKAYRQIMKEYPGGPYSCVPPEVARVAGPNGVMTPVFYTTSGPIPERINEQRVVDHCLCEAFSPAYNSTLVGPLQSSPPGVPAFCPTVDTARVIHECIENDGLGAGPDDAPDPLCVNSLTAGSTRLLKEKAISETCTKVKCDGGALAMMVGEQCKCLFPASPGGDLKCPTSEYAFCTSEQPDGQCGCGANFTAPSGAGLCMRSFEVLPAQDEWVGAPGDFYRSTNGLYLRIGGSATTPFVSERTFPRSTELVIGVDSERSGRTMKLYFTGKNVSLAGGPKADVINQWVGDCTLAQGHTNCAFPLRRAADGRTLNFDSAVGDFAFTLQAVGGAGASGSGMVSISSIRNGGSTLAPPGNARAACRPSPIVDPATQIPMTYPVISSGYALFGGRLSQGRSGTLETPVGNRSVLPFVQAPIR